MPLIENNPVIRDPGYFLSPSSAKEFAAYDAFVRRYVGYLTFALNYRLHGLDVTGYHVFNIAVHLLNAILVYILVLLTFQTPFLKGSSLERQSGSMALVAGLLFVAHPVQTEAVTHVFQRHASLAAFFYLLTLVSYAQSMLGGNTVFYVISIASAVLAMKTKENAFTLPFMVSPVKFVTVVQKDCGGQGFLGRGGPLKDFLCPVHPEIPVHLSRNYHFPLRGVPESWAWRSAQLSFARCSRLIQYTTGPLPMEASLQGGYSFRVKPHGG